MSFPYLRTTVDLKRDCLHCNDLHKFVKEQNGETSAWRLKICPILISSGVVSPVFFDERDFPILTCDMWSDRYTPRVEIKANKE